jgi:hypothetical protein
VTAPHDEPTAAQLVEAVREWIVGDIVAGEGEPNRFHARVAANMLAIVERELALGEQQHLEHQRRLETLGVVDDTELAKAIRDRSLDDRSGEVREVVWASVRDKLAVANPRYIERVEP